MDFFSIGAADAAGALNFSLVNDRDGSRFDELCSISDGVATPPSEPLAFTRQLGNRAFDILSESYGVVDFLSPRLTGILEEGEWSGWTTLDVDLSAPNIDADLSGYRGLVVTGRCGSGDGSPLKVEQRAARRGNGVVHVKVGFQIDERSWDGSDFFRPVGSRFTFVTERVATALASANVSNLSIDRVDELELGFARGPR